MQIPQIILKRCKIKVNKNDAPGMLRVDSILPDDPICRDCGKLCETQRIIYHVKIHYPAEHWRSQCQNCNCYYNPITKKFDLDSINRYNTFFREFLNEKDK